MSIVATVFTVVGGFFGIVRPRAKVTGEEVLVRYIDYQTNELVEEKEYSFTWAHYLGFLIGRKVTLPKFERNATLKVFCKPPISFKQTLFQECYEESMKGRHRYIHLVDRRYFEKQELERISVQSNTNQGEGYKRNITRTDQDNGVLIENMNREEIRNYQLELPHAKIEDVKDLLKYGGVVIVPEERPQGSNTPSPNDPQERGFVVTISKIGPMEGDTPGRAFVPL